jgi:uncharacterized MnhB-related membrane protein
MRNLIKRALKNNYVKFNLIILTIIVLVLLLNQVLILLTAASTITNIIGAVSFSVLITVTYKWLKALIQL